MVTPVLPGVGCQIQSTSASPTWDTVPYGTHKYTAVQPKYINGPSIAMITSSMYTDINTACDTRLMSALFRAAASLIRGLCRFTLITHRLGTRSGNSAHVSTVGSFAVRLTGSSRKLCLGFGCGNGIGDWLTGWFGWDRLIVLGDCGKMSTGTSHLIQKGNIYQTKFFRISKFWTQQAD